MMIYKNTWGSTESGIDQQRADMFRVSVVLPPQLRDGANVWDNDVAWAIEKFPFPDRDVEAVPVKYLQQTNYQIGADTASEAVEMTVKYAFNARTATLLERWKWLVSNPKTGGAGLSSAIKTTGYFYWLVPNTAVLGNEDAAERDSYLLLRAYELQGCWLKSLKTSDADMTQGNGVVTIQFRMQIDRYHPVTPSDLQQLYVPTFNSSEVIVRP